MRVGPLDLHTGVAIGSAALAAAAYGLHRFIHGHVYHPRREIMATPSEFGVDYEDVEFVAEDGCALHGWWIPASEASGTLLYCHGNAGNVGDRAALASELQRLGTNLFLFDYRGYGRSRGRPSERGTARDARAAYEVVRARQADVERPAVIAYGSSLGVSVAAQLALDRPLSGLILEGGFTSLQDMSALLYPQLPFRWLSRYRYDTVEKVAQLKGLPKLFAHSLADEVVPFELSRRLYERAAEPKQFFELAGSHSEPGWVQRPAYWQALEHFVRNVFPAHV